MEGCEHEWGAWSMLAICAGLIRMCARCGDFQVRGTVTLAEHPLVKAKYMKLEEAR